MGGVGKMFSDRPGTASKHSAICGGEPENTRNRPVFSRFLRFGPKIIRIGWDFVGILRIFAKNEGEF